MTFSRYSKLFVESRQFSPTPPAFGTSIGRWPPSEFCTDLQHQKPRVPGLLCGIVCMILGFGFVNDSWYLWLNIVTEISVSQVNPGLLVPPGSSSSACSTRESLWNCFYGPDILPDSQLSMSKATLTVTRGLTSSFPPPDFWWKGNCCIDASSRTLNDKWMANALAVVSQSICGCLWQHYLTARDSSEQLQKKKTAGVGQHVKR